MIKTVPKWGFNSKTLKTMKSGDTFVVVCKEYREMESAAQIVRNFKSRFGYPEGVTDIRSEVDRNTYIVQVTAK